MFPLRRTTSCDPSENKGSGGTSGIERFRRRNHANQSLPNKPPPPPQPNLYVPSIYSYTCRGVYRASSDTNEGSEGVCNGFKSQLEELFLERQEMLTRTEAVKRFTTMTTDIDYQDELSNNNNNDNSNETLNGMQTQALLISPALIFKHPSTSPPTNGNNKKISQHDETKDTNNVLNPLLKDLLPEEELIKRQDWVCYGSTEVEYLVLEDVQTGQKRITAVAPRNTGFSRRVIESSDDTTIRTINRIGLGWLDIVHDNHSIVVDSEDSSTATTNNNKVDQSSTISSEEMTTPRTSQEWLSYAQTGMQTTYLFSQKVANHMKQNVMWFGETIQDDFPQRTYQAGHKIITQIPVTIDKTYTAMERIVGYILGSDDDDGDDNNNDDVGGSRKY